MVGARCQRVSLSRDRGSIERAEVDELGFATGAIDPIAVGHDDDVAVQHLGETFDLFDNGSGRCSKKR